MDTKTNAGGNNLNTFDDDQHTFDKIETKLKDTVFGIVFALLKEQEISVHVSTVLVIIQMMQTIAFVFHETLAPAWDYKDITDVLYDIFGFFDLIPYIKDTNWGVYVAIMYIGIVAVVLTLALALFVHYSFSRKKISFSWPIVVLRFLVRGFTTILFLPFIDYFISMLGCVSNAQGISVHSFFSEVECWSGEHIIHAVFAILGVLIFVPLTLAVCVIFYEYKNNSNDAGAKASARPNLILNIYQMIMVICLTFLTDTDFRAILCILVFFGSGVVFLKFAYNPSYYDEFKIKLWSTLAAINFWGAVMVIFASILEGTLFRGSVIVWMVGIPFVGFIHLAGRDSRVGLLLININKFQNGAEIQNQIRYVTKLIKWRLTSKKAATLLEGYIGIHKQSCNEEDCPLRQKLLKNNRLIKTLMSQDENLNEKLALLIQLLNKIYSDGLKRFPNDTSLRISYAFFLLEKMHNKQQALQELTQAEQNKPNFDEQFIIYRYKKLVEDEIAESQNEGGGLDVITEVTFQNHLHHLQANIEKSALLHMEFWSQLSEGNPDLAKLNDIGSKINSSVQYVEDYWVKLIKINGNNAKSMKLYGKYLIEILNDKSAGEALLEKARSTANEANKKAVVAGGGAGDGFSSDITPSVWISGEQEKFGIITTLNLSAACLFGYSKTELLNQKVDVMMPQIYARYHDSFLENYINNGEPSIIGKNKEKLVFGKTKSGYIFPVYMNIKAIQSIIEGIQFVATFRTEKTFKNVAYVLTNLDGSIDSISASCINILKVDQKAVNLKKSNLQDYIPNIIHDRTKLFTSSSATSKVQATLTVNYPKDSEYLIEDEELSTQVHCQCTEMIFLTGKQNVGYQFRIERVYEKPPVLINQLEGKARISNFQFRFDRDKACITGEYIGDMGSDDPDGQPDDEFLKLSSQLDQSNVPSFVSDMRAKPQEEESEAQRVNYGIGIKTLRLVDGKPQEIEDLKSDESESEEGDGTNNSVLNPKNAKGSSAKTQNTQEQQLIDDEFGQDEGSSRDFTNTFKSRKALNTVVSDRSVPSTIRNLKLIANGLCIVLAAIAIADYVVARADLDDIKQDVDLFDKSNQCLGELMNVLSKTNDLYLLNLGVMTGLSNETSLRSQLTTSLNNAKALKVILDSKTSSLSSDHLALLNNPNIPLLAIDGTITMKGLTQATEEVISRAFEMLTRPLYEIKPSSAEYYYLSYNMLNDYYSGMRTSADMYAIEMSENVDDKNQAFLLLLIGSIIALVVALLMCFPILYQVNRSKEEVLTLFLDIPEKTVKGLYGKCEVFLSNLQIGEEDEIMSEIDAEDLEKTQTEHDNHKELVPRKKRKHFKNSVRNQRSFFLLFFVIAALVEAYFLFNYITSVNLLDDFKQLAIEINATSIAFPFYSFVINVDKQLWIDSTFPVLHGDSETLTGNNVKAQFVLDASILEQHSINRNIHTETYIKQFNQIMMSDPCNSYYTTVNVTKCETTADGTVAQGTSVAITRHFENLRSLLTCYTSIGLGQACAITLPTITINSSVTATADQILIWSLMASTKATESNTLLYRYIKYGYEALMINFKNSIDEEFSSNLTRRLIMFIVFLILIGVVYSLLWLSLVRKISNDVWRTRSMLSMIPLSVIARIKSIRLYLKKFWNQRNVDEN